MATAAPDVVRTLLVEDDEDDYLIARNLLDSQSRTRFEVEWCPSYELALPVIAERRHDVYLIDYRLGRETGLSLIRDAFSGGEPAPVIMLTGHPEDHDIQDVDLEAADLGVTDFLSKGQLDATLLERSIRYAIKHNRALAALRESRERFALAVRGAHDGIWDWDLHADRIYLGRRWKEILGCSDADVGDGLNEWLDRIHADDIAGVKALIDAHLAGETEHFQSEHRIRHADGGYRWVLNRGVAVRDGDGRPARMAGSMSDISDRKAAEQQLRHDALHDSLTGLPNRTLFLDRLGVALRRASRSAMSHAVLFIDVDRFKLINDGYSHAVGDELLVAIARRLEADLRPGDTVARLGGDEFTILLEGIDPADGPAQVAERVHAALREPFLIAGQELGITTSIGIAISDIGSDPAELVRNADIAMYDAKTHPDPAVAVFDVGMRSRVVAQLQVEAALRKVLEEGRLEIAYQPIIDLSNRRIAGFEALARWPEADRESVSPAEFIPVAEDTGLIRPLGEFVLDGACAQLASWTKEGLVADGVTMSVNVSGRQLSDPDFHEVVRETLKRHGLPGRALQIELTESTVIDARDEMRDALGKLEKLGVRAHLDDFGTGYSSLTFLHHFPVAVIKVDRSFVASMHTDSSKEEIVRAIIELAHTLRLGVIAEGVEETGQVEILESVGCEYAQGYLFARPLKAEAVEEMLATSPYAPAAGAF